MLIYVLAGLLCKGDEAKAVFLEEGGLPALLQASPEPCLPPPPFATAWHSFCQSDTHLCANDLGSQVAGSPKVIRVLSAACTALLNLSSYVPIQASGGLWVSGSMKLGMDSKALKCDVLQGRSVLC